MKLICHFLSHSRNLLLAVVMLFFLTVDTAAKARLFINTSLVDTTFKDSIKRQVLLSQQLFVVKITPAKGKKKKGIVDVKAELRDAFTVILYTKDTARIELEDAMCPDGKCPVGEMYDYGTAEYKHLDLLMADARRRLAESTKATKRLMERLKRRGDN